MRNVSVLLVSILILTASAYSQFQFTSLDYPGASVTAARGINNSGEMVGSYRIVTRGNKKAQRSSKVDSVGSYAAGGGGMRLH